MLRTSCRPLLVQSASLGFRTHIGLALTSTSGHRLAVLSPSSSHQRAAGRRASPIHSGTPQGSSAASTDMAQQPSPGKSKAQSAFIPVQLDSGRLGLQGGPTLVRNVPSHVRETQPPSSSQEGSTAASQPEGALLGVSCQGGNTSYANIYLGELSCKRWVASARNKLWWMTPEFGTSARELPPEVQFLLVEVSAGGPYALFLPLLPGNKFRASLRRSPAEAAPEPGKSSLWLRIESGDTAVNASSWDDALYVAAGWDPYKLLDTAIPWAASLAGTAKPRADKAVPASLDTFGWCTWDAFYFTVSAQGVGQGLGSLQEGGAPPQWLVIDDGWQMTQLDSQYKPHPRPYGPAKRERTPEQLPGSSNGSAKHGSSSDLPGHDSTASRTYLGRSTTSTGLGLQGASTTFLQGAWHLATTPFRVLGYARDTATGVAASAVEYSLHKVNNYAQELDVAGLPYKAMGYVAAGPLRSTVLGRYAADGDHPKRMVSAEANSKFADPNTGPDEPWQGREPDLAGVVTHFKQTYGVKWVYCWHALAAYWAGVHSSMSKYDPRTLYPQPAPGVLEVDPSMAWSCQALGGVGVVHSPEKMYEDMHSYLQDCGVDGVKVDVQGTVGMCGKGFGGGAAISRRFHDALEDSVQQHFPGNHMINCMCHDTQDLYRMRDTLVARCSDDFYPRDPASHTSHMGICAYNSLFMGALVQPDWDMFQSQHPAGLLHATARAISGGPLYVSDGPGKHDFSLLARVVLPDGGILRALQPARPTLDCLFSDPLRDKTTMLKVWNTNHCGGVVGVFNVQGASWSRTKHVFVTHDPSPPPLEAVVRPQDVAPFAGLGVSAKAEGSSHMSARFAMYSDQSGTLQVGGLRDGMRLCLEPAQSDVITVAPCTTVGDASFAAIGLENMLNAGGAVRSLKLHGPNKAHTGVTIALYGTGNFVAYCSKAPKSVQAGSQEASYNFDHDSSKLTVQIRSQQDLHSEVHITF